MSTDLSIPQQKILDALTKAQKPLSAYDLLDKLRRFGLRSPPTIYRALDQLKQQGLVHRIETLNAFVACKAPHTHDNDCAFAICSTCGAVAELPAPPNTPRLKAYSFLVQVDHKCLEISGLCRSCAAPSCKK